MITINFKNSKCLINKSHIVELSFIFNDTLVIEKSNGRIKEIPFTIEEWEILKEELKWK